MFLIQGALALSIISLLRLAVCESNPSSLSQNQATADIRSRINRGSAQSENINSPGPASINLPTPEPFQTLGDYLDDVDNILNDTNLNDTSTDAPTKYKSFSQINSRNFVRTGDFRKSVWFDGTEHYNISISKCIRFSETIGRWTHLDDTTQPDATLSDITGDLSAHFRNTTDLSNFVKARLLANAELAASEAEASLQSTICNYAQPAAHDELRKLLAPTPVDHLNTKFFAVDGYWTGVLVSMGAGATVGGSLYKGFYNRNATAENVALTCFTAAGLIFTRGVIERLYMNGVLAYAEASVIAAFTAWFRQAVAAALSLQREFLQQVGSDQRSPSGCLERAQIESGIEGWQGYSEPEAGVIEMIPMGRC